LASIMVMASCVAVLFGDKIRSQSKPFLYLFQLVAAKDPVHVALLGRRRADPIKARAGKRLTDRPDTLTQTDFWKSVQACR
ncbi:hypothetical protein, partial [Aeromonas caviae]|uniref:hypothetical protein n=1 Tax=Aeromonas caviae TaxID=648 RepID=UPI001F3C42A6